MLNRRKFITDSVKVVAGAGMSAGLGFVRHARAESLAATNPIAIENQKQGTRDWEIFDPSFNNEIAGYASRTAVRKGSDIAFYVSTTEPFFYGEIFRIGWYGGLGGCRYTDVYTFPGTRQTVPAPNSSTGLVNCNWTSAGTVSIPSDWTTGLYLVRLTAGNSGKQSYIPFVVYDDQPADYLFQLPFTTWQAYNNYGGKSLYDFNSTGGRRAYKVSFNRPYAQGWGAGYLIAWEICMLRFLEREGYHVNYVTDFETHSQPSLLPRHRCVIVAGHDEYWSRPMRVNFDSAVNKRVNLAFFGANCAFWQVRFESSTFTPNPIMTCYKSAALDPFATSRTNRQLTTVLFKDPLINLPEGRLMGVEYQDYGAEGDVVIERPDHWVFANTGAQVGTRLRGLVGVEYDRITANSPSNIVRLAPSPVTSTELGNGFSDMTIFTAPSGAQVFSAGTITWPNGLDSYNTRFSLPNVVNPIAQQITRNVLNRFAGR